MIKIEVHRNETSLPITHQALNAYTKGGMYCVMIISDGKRITHKYPLCSLFRVTEDYNAQPTGCEDNERSVGRMVDCPYCEKGRDTNDGPYERRCEFCRGTGKCNEEADGMEPPATLSPADGCNNSNKGGGQYEKRTRSLKTSGVKVPLSH